MKVLCLLLVSGLALAYALPNPTYRAGPVQMFDEDESVEDDAEVDDDVADDNNDMYTFGTGGPDGPPSNMYVDGPQGRSNEGSELSPVFYASEKDIPEGVLFTYDDDKVDAAPALLPQGRKEKVGDDEDKKEDEKEGETEDEEEQEDAEESQEDEEEEGDDAEQDDDSEGFSVPDMNKLFPNPNNLPVGPGSYNSYMQHLPKNKQQQQGAQEQEQPGRGYILPPQNRYAASGYQGRVPVPFSAKPARRFRSEVPLMTKFGGFVQIPSEYGDDDTVVVEAAPIMYRAEEQEDNMVDEEAEAEDDAEDSQEDEEEADDDVDFSVPSFETLFPQPSEKATPGFYGGMKNSWNNAPKPPSQQERGRILRLFHSPLHDDYNPEFVVDPTAALNARNERLRHRYSSPHWRIQNVKTPWNYKPLLYQQGHYGNPREYDIHPQSGHIYSGGIYSGKHYV